jgi:hypothetical protein
VERSPHEVRHDLPLEKSNLPWLRLAPCLPQPADLGIFIVLSLTFTVA